MHDSKLVRFAQMFSVVGWQQFLHTAITTHKPLEITNFYSNQSRAKSVHVWVSCCYYYYYRVKYCYWDGIFGNFLWQFSCINKLNNAGTICQLEVTVISISWALPGNTATYSMVHSTAFQATRSKILDTISTSRTRAVINCRLKYDVLETVASW